jgi:thiosulfate/3-mercaptopyruvate sulfurtransferase
MKEQRYTRSDLLTTPQELHEKLGSPNLCLIDTRPAELFARGQIPGAVHFDLFGVSLIDTSPAPLRAFLFMIHHLLEMRGVDTEKEVVFYEENSGVRAARGLWFLEYFGHPDARVLDGGMRAWSEAGFPVSTDPASPKPSRFKISERTQLLATADDVLRSLDNKNVAIVDTRGDDEYMGRNIRAARGGAIPGAIHIEWTQNLDPSGRYKSVAELKAMYEKVGITRDKEAIPYCQGGYRSAHTYLALRLCGFPKTRNYLGSWGEWGNRPDLPIEKPWEKK